MRYTFTPEALTLALTLLGNLWTAPSDGARDIARESAGIVRSFGAECAE